MSASTFAEQSRSNGVRSALTPPRRTRATVENKDFAAFAGRILKAFARRVAEGDVEALADLLAFSKQIDRATRDAVGGLREFGYSWAEIAQRAGITKQTAQERWGTTREPTTTPNVLQRKTNGTAQAALFDFTGGES